MGFWRRLTEFLWSFHVFDQTPIRPLNIPDHQFPTIVDVFDAESIVGGTCNSPNNRQCWSPGFDINTDYEDSRHIPEGVTRKYFLNVTNEVIRPDGYEVERMLFNGQYPGPLIEGNWGDWFEITVLNSLQNNNGTSIHWHGIRQLNSNWMDGVSGVTECPIPPGESFTYRWRATQYGTSWYHSHFSLQYADGLLGPLKINGPTSKNFDVDLGPVLLTDHFHKTAFSQIHLEYLGRPPAPDSFLLNGKGKYYCCPTLDPLCIGDSEYEEFHFKEGTTYKMSLVNTATATHMTFWIDGHEFWVVAADFVPIEPYKASMLNIAIGQRYDIVVKANPPKGDGQTDYWIHARDCANGNARSTLGIIRYNESSNFIPYTPLPENNHLCYGCLDEMNFNLKPIVPRNIISAANGNYSRESFKVHLVGSPDEYNKESLMHKWVLKDSTFWLDWNQPSMSLINVAKKWGELKFPKGYEPVNLDGYKTESWVWFLIEGKFNDSLPEGDRTIYKTQAPVAHPIHIHGHDFVILASGASEYDGHVVPNLVNPPRRDVALLPVNGYLLIAFQINNPGVWLMHCHIAWHASGGLALQFVEKPDELRSQFRASGIVPKYSETCANWSAYYTMFNKNEGAEQDDSGI